LALTINRAPMNQRTVKSTYGVNQRAPLRLVIAIRISLVPHRNGQLGIQFGKFKILKIREEKKTALHELKS
jgi:hypothetical protein